MIRADFHPEVAGVVLALAAGWAALTGRGRATWILAALALSAREDVTYAVFVVGLATWALGHGRARWRGAALAIVATGWALLVFGILMPIARDGAIVDTAVYYRWLGSGPQILLAPFRMPDRLIAALTQDRTWFKIAGLLVSLVGLPLLRPRWLLLLAPPLVAVLLSHHPPQALLLLQYPIILVAPALVATAFGARRALALLGRHARRPGRVGGLGVVGLAGPALVVAVVQGSVPPFDRGAAAPYERPAAIGALRMIAGSVPSDALLVVDEGLAAPLASRLEIRLVNRNPRNITGGYVLLDAEAWSPSAWASTKREQAITRINGEDRRVIAADGRFTLLGPATGDAP